MPAIRLSFALAALAVLALASGAQAEVTPHALFSDHAVLQQGVSLPIWGTARDGEKVTVQLAGQTATTTTIDGKWRVEFPPLKPGGPHVLTLQGDNTVTINDVLVGEVWLCSGQSNMEFSLGALPLWAKEKPRAELPGLRMFKVTRQIGVEPMANVVGQWSVCAPETAGRFSAVGYFFGRDLHAARDVPVGIINSSKGGTWAQAWVGLKGYESNPGYAKTAERIRANVAEYPQRLADHPAKIAAYEEKVSAWQKTDGPRQEAALSTWKKKSYDAKKNNTPFAEPEPPITFPKPKEPDSPEGGPNGYAALFNGMIAPLAPYALAGVAWYQGESNSNPKGVPLYEAILSTLVTDWRREFNRPDLPFLIVQLPGYKSLRPEIREAQLNVSRKLPPAALVVTTDLGDTDNLHPKDKEPVGTRLALAARGLAYGEKIDSSGPLFASLKTEGGRAVVSFTHTGGGLVAVGGALKGFTLAGPDNVFVPATAVISGDTVLVSSSEIHAPVAVRYGWATVPDGNLSNAAGLPASPFRSDR